MADKLDKSDAEWKAELTEDQYAVARKGGTERAFTGAFWETKDPGTYKCVCCGTPLFDSETKFDSGSGWPSYFEPIADDVISEHDDSSLGVRRVEVKCRKCDAHLGHVFEDGPAPTGLRYCINSVCLTLDKKP